MERQDEAQQACCSHWPCVRKSRPRTPVGPVGRGHEDRECGLLLKTLVVRGMREVFQTCCDFFLGVIYTVF